MSQPQQRRFMLPESELPTHFYNIAADLPEPAPPVLHPGTREPIGPADLAPLFPMELIKQEVSTERFIEIPEPVREAYRIYRPSPLIRALGLERALDTPAHIYYKYEGVSPAGSHKPNTAIAQAYYNKAEGINRLVTETGAGQWGSALAFAGSLFGLDVKVFMVQGQLRAEAVSALASSRPSAATVVAVAVDRDERRTHHPGGRSRLDRQPGDRHQRGGRGGRHQRRHEVLAGQRPEPRPAAPDGDRAGGDPADGDGRRGAGRRDRLRRRRLELLGDRLPVPARQAGRGFARRDSWRSSRRPARP